MFDIKDITPAVNIYTGCDYHRIIQPLKYMGMDLSDYTNVSQSRLDDIMSKTKILIFNRKPQAGIALFEAYKKKYGFKIVCDIDDYWELYYQHPLHRVSKEFKDAEKQVYNIKIADAVFVTTSQLADKVLKYNKNVYVVPNGLPFDKEQFTDNREPSDNYRVIYAGGTSHFWDVQELRYAFEKLNGWNIPNLQVILAGHDGKTGGEWDKIERVFKQMKNYQRYTSLDLLSYMNQYTRSDLSLAPLQKNLFNTYKSNLKVLEAGCKRIPIITSNMLPYSNPDDFDYITVASNTREWVEAILQYSKNPNFSKERGQALGEYVRQKYDLQKINELRQQIFEYLIN